MAGPKGSAHTELQPVVPVWECKPVPGSSHVPRRIRNRNFYMISSSFYTLKINSILERQMV